MTPAEEKFKNVVRQLHTYGIYPGPTAINDALGRGEHNNHLNGRETRWRREIMAELGIPLKRPSLLNNDLNSYQY